jgi:hypothetical protein
MKAYVALILFCFTFVRGIGQVDRSKEELHPDRTGYSRVEQMAFEVLEKGFNAGDGYQQVWARDLNTFVRFSCRVLEPEVVREALIRFFYFQGFDGNMVDGYEEVEPGYEADNYHVYARYDMPGYVFHKNTVETDQETSLIQAVYKYISETGDSTILKEVVNGSPVLARMNLMLDFLMKHRFTEKYGLIWGATTVDWGDVQPKHTWGVKLDDQSVISMDIYDNAMMLIALDNFLEICDVPAWTGRWEKAYNEIRENTRKYLWDPNRQKFRPHLYLDCREFEGINEEEIYLHGGTIVAMEAGLLSREEIGISLQTMRENIAAAGAQSIGLTIYPAYPDDTFENRGMGAYQYQNGGDWTWFGARIIPVLVREGMMEEAVRELQPFIDRVIENDGFYEWYTLDGQPRGSGIFKGSAGVLLEAIESVRSAETGS